MKHYIIHCSDLHLRGLQYIDEIQYTFDKLNEDIDKLFKDNIESRFCLVVTGDIFHSKLTVTNEYFVAVIDLFKRLADKLPVVIIPGNHDLSLPNKDRMDAITPFVKALEGKTTWPITYSKKSEKFPAEFVEKHEQHDSAIESKNIWFHHFSILEPKHKWPTEKNIIKNAVNIALYHGSINDSEVDSGWTSRGNQDDLTIFKGFQAAFLGDIHKSQFLKPTIAYPGSIRQNNFGETLEKGYILWTIDDNMKISGEMKILPQKRYFITLIACKESEIEKPTDDLVGSRVRVKLSKEIDIVEEIKIKNKIEELWKPTGDIEFILPEILQRVDTRIEVDSDKEILQENIRNLEVQKSLIDKFFENKDLKEEDFSELYELDKKYHTSIKTDLFRNIKWNIEELEWDNLFSYGRDNKVDFKKLNGVIGINGKNGSGKSSLIDILTLTMFNSITKEGANKNFDFINRKSKNGWSKMKISLNGDTYVIERGGKKIGKVEDEKVDNSIDFYKIDKDGNKKLLNGETKPDTNAAIRDIFGSIDDFSVTSLCSQFGLSKFIDARATERKKTISKFFDLDIFEQKYQLAVEHYKDVKSQLKLFDISNLTKDIENNKKQTQSLKIEEEELDVEIVEKKQLIRSLEESLFNKAKIIFNFEQRYDKKELLKRKQLIQDEIQVTHHWIERLVKENENSTFKGTREEGDQIMQSWAKKKNNLKVLNAQLEDNKKAAALINKIPGAEICKTCPVVEHAWKASEKLLSLQKEIENISFTEQEINCHATVAASNVVFTNTNTIKSLNQNLINYKEKIDNIDLQIKFCEENEEKLNSNFEIEKEIKELKDKKIQTEKELNSLEIELRNVRKNIAIAEANVINLDNKILEAKVLSHKNYIYELYLECMGKNGISYWIICKKIPLINNILNKIISQIWKIKISIENDEEEKTLKIYCIDEGGRRPIELLSGAEKAVVSLALRTAFWYVSSLPKCSMLILDESFSYVEADKIDSVMKALNYLKNYFSNIIMITHDDSLKSYADHTLYVNKVNGFSKIGE